MKSVEELIETKFWTELTDAERLELADLATSEEEFNNLKFFLDEMNPLVEAEQLAVNPEIKSSLDTIFQAKHPGIVQPWEVAADLEPEVKIIPFYNRTWFRVAAVLLIGTGITTLFWKTSLQEEAEQKTQLAQEKVLEPKAPQAESKIIAPKANIQTKSNAETSAPILNQPQKR